MTADLAAPPQCIKRPHSRWTLCPCPDCRALTRTNQKRNRYGYIKRASATDAAKRLQGWLDAGYSSSWISSATGVPVTFVQKFSEGKRHNIGPVRAELILNGDITTGTTGYGPAHGTVRRLQALAAIGWSLEEIHATTGLPMATLSHAQRGNRHQVRHDIMQTVAEHFARVAMTPGPSRIVKKRAAKLGWAPPLAWDDIDDPNATPDTGDARRPGGKTVHVDEIEWLLGQHPLITTTELAARFGVTRSAVQHALEPDRGNRPDLLARLARNAEVSAA